MTALGQRQETLLPESHLQVEKLRDERRTRLRITGCYPASVRWPGLHGPVKQEAILDNLSSKGLYMRVRHKMVSGQKAFVVFYMADAMKMTSRQMSSAMVSPIKAPRIAVRGSVLRTEVLGDGLWGVVIVFEQHRFL